MRDYDPYANRPKASRYPQAIRSELGKTVVHRTNVSLNNRLGRTIVASGDEYDVREALVVSSPPAGSVVAMMSFATSSASVPFTASVSPPIAAVFVSFAERPPLLAVA